MSRITQRDDDPIPLATAAADFNVTKGVLKAAGLRGRLEMYKLGKQYYTTPNAVRDWVLKCRVEQKAQGSILINRDEHGSLEMDRSSTARDALMTTLAEIRQRNI